MIRASGMMAAGAIVLFVIFIAALFLLERKQKKAPVRLRVIRCQKTDRAA